MYSPAIIGDDKFYQDEVSTIINIRISNYSAWPPRVENQLAYRYYFNISEVLEAGYTIEDVTVDIISDTELVLSEPIQLSGTLYFIEIYYQNVEIFPGGNGNEYKEATVRIGLPAFQGYTTGWNSDNDWSYQELSNNWIIANNIPVYDKMTGTLLFGSEPN